MFGEKTKRIAQLRTELDGHCETIKAQKQALSDRDDKIDELRGLLRDAIERRDELEVELLKAATALEEAGTALDESARTTVMERGLLLARIDVLETELGKCQSSQAVLVVDEPLAGTGKGTQIGGNPEGCSGPCKLKRAAKTAAKPKAADPRRDAKGRFIKVESAPKRGKKAR